MANFVRFLDACNLKPLDISDEVKDFYANMDMSNVKPLRVRIAATHSGKVTRNNGFYLPDKMRRGANTFTDQYPKPIQVHHEDHKDPIGRVVSASYVDISGMMRDSISDSVSKKAKKRIKDFIDGKLKFDDAVEFVNDYFIQDLKFSSDPDYQGLGYIELIADISEPDAIRKVLDGRYLTGSVGASTNKAICSICKQNWASDGRCDHRPGKLYDKAKCVLIAGDLAYDEYSFVNRPADRHSRVIEVNINGIQDFVQLDESESIPEINLVIDNTSEEDKNMTFKDAIKLARENEKLQGLEKLEDKVKEIVDSLEDATEESFISAMLDKFVEEESTEEVADETDTSEENTEEVEDEEETEEDPIKVFFGDEYDEIVGEDEWGREYAEMIMDGLADESIAEELKDKKLSAAERKKLPDSVFCGPDRSYPVNDCGHAKSAMAYAKKHDESSSVVACIRRKAKRLGCAFDGDKKDSALDNFSVEALDRFSDEEMIVIFDNIQASINERGMEIGNTESVEEAQESLKNEIKELTQSKEEMKERLEAAHKEIRYLHSDIDNLNNSMADMAEEVRMAHIDHVTDLVKLERNTTDITELSDELKDKTSQEVKEMLKDLGTKVDMQKIIDTLNSGLSNNPTEEVDDPTLIQDNTVKPEDTVEEIEISDTLREEMKETIDLYWLQNRINNPELLDKWKEEQYKRYGIKIPEDSNKEE